MRYSVLMSVYKKDSAEFLRDSLMSMINQTIRPTDIVVVKAGPITDNLQKVIDDLNDIYKSIITEVAIESNVGLGMALNAGIPFCKEAIIARMDSDDISEPSRCEKQLLEFEKNPKLDIIGTCVKEFQESTSNVISIRRVPTTNEGIYEFARIRDPFNHPTVMYKKSILEEVGGYSDLRKNQDSDLWVKLLLKGCICQNLSEPLLFFRFDEGTYRKRKSWENTKLLIKVRYKAFSSGLSSMSDFSKVVLAQLLVFLSPIALQRLIYKRILRK